jgi:hypothetical protein
MNKKIILAALFCSFLTPFLQAQNTTITNQKVNVFFDCQSWRCNNYYDYIRTEVKMVEFVRDRFFSDVHILITEQSTGSGGSQFTMNFLGQKRFQGQNDTLICYTEQNATSDEIRNSIVNYMKIGLIHYVAKTDGIKALTINYEGKEDETKEEKDPWNYWVYSIGGNGFFFGDANYSNTSYDANLSANRITDKMKCTFWGNYNYNKDIYRYDSDTVRVENNRVNFGMEYAKSLGQHWSVGTDLTFRNSSFDNINSRVNVLPKIEYSIFPYKSFNSQRIVFGYALGVQHNSYLDSTIYFTKRELLGRQEVYAIASFTKKWGNINLGTFWSNYLHNFSINNFSVGGAVEWRIFKGMRFVTWGNYEFVRDQISLPKGNATRDDVLTKRRLIASGFNYNMGIGLRYQFGSQKNSFVNPRFNGLNYSISL